MYRPIHATNYTPQILHTTQVYFQNTSGALQNTLVKRERASAIFSKPADMQPIYSHIKTLTIREEKQWVGG
jgi:hypothetical protein